MNQYTLHVSNPNNIVDMRVCVHDKTRNQSLKKTDYLDSQTIFHLNDAKQNKMLCDCMM